ncbi:cytochrome P450 [Nemania sp. NC0429]|nr:cytochrome P450 [Nemania sp. NC0429]
MAHLVTFNDTLEMSSIGALILSGTLLVLGWWAVQYWMSPLRSYPGPILAGCTNWWRLVQVMTGRYHLNILELHNKYGPIVRIGPNLLDIDMPEVIKTVYASGTNWRKTDFYQNNSLLTDGKITYTIFSEADPAKHARLWRPIAKFFGQGNVLTKEIFVDKVVEDMCQRLSASFGDKDCDLGEWISFCTWDILGMMIFSQPFGYIDNGRDFDGTIKSTGRMNDYFCKVGQLPFLDHLLDKNPIICLGPAHIHDARRLTIEHLGERARGGNGHTQAGVPDFLQHFIDAKDSNPEFTDVDIVSNSLSILAAGADTTGLTLRNIFYHSLKNPEIYSRLESEILEAELGQLASYRQSRAIPYLEAVVREGMRILPAVSMLLERYVPAPGLTLPDGRIIPAGTAVGVNAYVMGRNKKVWGSDANEFRPERWLQHEDESDSAYHARIQMFSAADLTFGDGARVCIGRHIANLEMYKIVATLITRFEISLVDREREWEVVGSWVPNQRGLVCRLKERSS